MFDSLGSWSKPVSGHRFHKTPFSYSSMSSNSHYVAERPFRQRLDGLHYKVVYCPELEEPLGRRHAVHVRGAEQTMPPGPTLDRGRETHRARATGRAVTLINAGPGRSRLEALTSLCTVRHRPRSWLAVTVGIVNAADGNGGGLRFGGFFLQV